MKDKDALLRELVEDTPFQPATSLWRAVELCAVLEMGLPEGRARSSELRRRLTRRILQRTGSRAMVGIDLDPRGRSGPRLGNLRIRAHRERRGSPGARRLLRFRVLQQRARTYPILRRFCRSRPPAQAGRIADLHRARTPLHEMLHGPCCPGGSGSLLPHDGPASGPPSLFFTDNSAEWLAPAGFTVEETRPYLTRAQLRRWENVARCTSGLLYTLMGRGSHP